MQRRRTKFNLIYRTPLTLTTSVLLAQIRKPPDIAQTDAVSDNTEKKLHFPTPRRPVLFLRFSTSNILSCCRHDRHVVAGLAVVVQGSQLVPISSGLDYHSPVGLDGYTMNRSLLPAGGVLNWDLQHTLRVCLPNSLDARPQRASLLHFLPPVYFLFLAYTRIPISLFDLRMKLKNL